MKSTPPTMRRGNGSKPTPPSLPPGASLSTADTPPAVAQPTASGRLSAAVNIVRANEIVALMLRWSIVCGCSADEMAALLITIVGTCYLNVLRILLARKKIRTIFFVLLLAIP